jgi:hypothetical protein
MTETVLGDIKPGKVYIFYFNDGYIYQVMIEKNSGTTVTGKIESVDHENTWRGEDPKKDKLMDEKQKEPFSYGYSEIQDKTKKITTRQFNPVLTMLGVGSLIVITIGLINFDPL